MRGFITDRDLSECEKNFPGICRFYRDMRVKPATFLQLLWAFQAEYGCGGKTRGEGRPGEPPASLGH